MKRMYLIGKDSNDVFCTKHKRVAKRMVTDLNKDLKASFNLKKNHFWYECLPVLHGAKDISNLEKANSMWYAPKSYMFKK